MTARKLITHAFVLAGLIAAAQPAYATFHLMQIEQVIGGVNGDTTAQAIQLRMRTGLQNALAPARMRAFDAQGLNPIVIVDFASSVIEDDTGDRVLIASAGFASQTTPGAVPDFTMASLIPASYLAAGSLTFETDNGVTIYWRLSWGGASYTGPTTGNIANDANGQFGPPWPGPLPSTCAKALRFLGAATASSSTNAADYDLSAGAAVFISNAPASFTVNTQPGACCVDPDCGDGVGCTDDVCTAGSCASTPNDANCPDDGDFCTGSEFCDALSDCLSTGDPCTGATVCDEKQDACVDACNGDRHLVAFLDRVQEGHDAATGIGSFGCGRFEVDTDVNRVCFHIAYTPLASGEQISHIHGPADPGTPAAPIFFLPDGNPKIGVWTYDEFQEADILAGRMYVNVHSNDFPAGEIRGQMVDMVASLNGAQEGNASPDIGFGTFMIDTAADTLDFYIDYDPPASGETIAHIHGMALHTVTAPPKFLLPAGNPKVGTWNYDPADEAAILAGLTYVNIHSTDFPAGEIRGQITAIVSPMDHAQEFGKASPAAGCTMCSIDKDADDLGFDVRFDALEGTEAIAHIHGFAPPGQIGGVLFILPLGSPKLGIWDFDELDQANIQAGLTYVNVHSDLFPVGEIRGQIEFPAKRGCSLEACADLDNDGMRDDPCAWYECLAGACNSVARSTQADLGDLSGACTLDNSCDGGDRFHALNCFANLNTQGTSGYPCEADPPNSMNVDGGGPASCLLDGVCDNNDVFHALNCFADQDFDSNPGYPCLCGPAAVHNPARPEPVAKTTLVLHAEPVIRSADLVEVHAFLGRALDDLRGYQLHVGASGGRSGRLELVDIAVDDQRRDFVYSGLPYWSAFNPRSAQMLAGLDSGVPAAAGAYLATFIFQASADAAGDFVVDVRYDNDSVTPRDRTFLTASPFQMIAVQGTTPAEIMVGAGRRTRTLQPAPRQADPPADHQHSHALPGTND